MQTCAVPVFGILNTRVDCRDSRQPVGGKAGSLELGAVISLQPVNTGPTLKEHIYTVLRKAILEVDIYGAEVNLRLDERALAEQLGISRTPLREALSRLEHEGLVRIQARKGVYMTRKSREEIVELVTVWAALESMAARLACERASDSEIDRLRLLGASYTMDSARARLNEYSEANIEFHRTIISLSKCTALRKTADDLLTHLQPVRRRAMRDTTRTDRSVVDHTGIIEAISARRAGQASDLVREHTMRLGDYISRTWKNLDAAEVNQGNGHADQFSDSP